MDDSGQNEQVEGTSRKRSSYSLEQKVWICDKKQRDNLSYNNIREIFPAQWDGMAAPSKSTLSEIVKGADIWREKLGKSGKNAKLTKVKKAKFQQVDDALKMWVEDVIRRKGSITDDILRQQARIFAEKLNLPDFSAGNSWLDRFKRESGVKSYATAGEAGSAPEESVLATQAWLPVFFGHVGVEMDDVFNQDETGVYFRQTPRRTLATKKVAGLKLAKDRITMSLTSNLTGKTQLNLYF
jgi:hypothetical protein